MRALCIIAVLFLVILVNYQAHGNTRNAVPNSKCAIMQRFSTIDYDWPSAYERTSAISRGDYILENNIITGVKVYKDTVYVTVPRWRDGVPSSLNSVTYSDSGELILRPFPTWTINKQWDCDAIQYAQSMEIDPNTGYMWILDTGRANSLSSPSPPNNLCPPKLWIVDIETKTLLRVYTFPSNVVSPTSNFMNDIVLDYVRGEVKFAYISDTSDAKLYVYDYENNQSWFYQHDSMKPKNGTVSRPVDGIAMSNDFLYVFYSPLGAQELYAIPTWVLRTSSSDFANNLSSFRRKVGGSDGMICGETALYYGDIYHAAVLRVSKVFGSGHEIDMASESVILSEPETAQWPDTFAFNGTDLWFTANNLSAFLSRQMDFSGNTTNVFIWKCNVEDHGYLWNARQRTRHYLTPGLFG